jgi:AcrR family transcriptional regulator
MPKAFSDTERERIKAKLIKAGQSLINRMGLRHLCVDDAAHAAGISKGSFYSFFPSREEFILSVFEAWEAEYRGALIKEISESKGTARERVQRFFLGAFAILEKEPGLTQMNSREIQAIIERLPPERLKTHQDTDNRVLGEAFGRWISEGLLVPDLSEAMRGLVPMLFSIVIHRDDFPPGTYQPAVKLICEALAMRIGGRR